MGLVLDGIDDFVIFGNPDLFEFTDNAFSIEAWVAVAETQRGNNHTIFGKTGHSWVLGYEHKEGQAARYHIHICGDSGCGVGRESAEGSSRPFGSFRHVAITKSTYHPLAIYVDGVKASQGGGFMTLFPQTVEVVAGRSGNNYLKGVIDEIRVHDTYLTPGEVEKAFRAGPDKVISPEEVHPGRLNNLVTELRKLEGSELRTAREIEFTLPRTGWVMVSASRGEPSVGARVEVELAGAQVFPQAAENSGPLEAMRWLEAGTHTLVMGQGADCLERLVVRAIPELILWRYPVTTQLSQQKPVWDWEELHDKILPHLNTIATAGAVLRPPQRSQHQTFFDQWRAEGKRWFGPSKVPAYEFGFAMTEEQAYRFWAGEPGYLDEELSGLIIDEFSVGDFPNGQYIPMTEAIRRLHREFPDKLFYPFAVHVMNSGEPGVFAKEVVQQGGAILWEWYEREEPDEHRARLKLAGTLSYGMQNWRDFLPEAQRNICLALGYYSAPPLSLNENPAVDYKVWMDLQFHTLANDSRFDGLRGILEWNSKYTDEETLRWQAALYRHYAIEGQTTLLSEKHGFRYRPQLLENPDFDEGMHNWTGVPAEGGSMGTASLEGFGRLQGRVRGSTRGDAYLWMRRSARAPNRVSQTLKNLEPGRLYSLKVITADREDYRNVRSVERRHVFRIDLDNVDLLSDRGYQEVIQSVTGQEVPPFSRAIQPWFNYHYRLFRARGESATLTFSDWAGEGVRRGPVGQELMINFVEAQPYFAAGAEFPLVLEGVQSGPATGICFPTVVGQTYFLQEALARSGPWVDSGMLLHGNGTPGCLIAPAPGGDQKSYRVRSEDGEFFSNRTFIAETLVFSFASEVGSRYSLHSSSTLETPFRETGFQILGTGGRTSFVVPVPSTSEKPKEFYRVEQSRP